MKRSGFKMRSGNGPLPFKQMGGSPVRRDSGNGSISNDQTMNQDFTDDPEYDNSGDQSNEKEKSKKSEFWDDMAVNALETGAKVAIRYGTDQLTKKKKVRKSGTIANFISQNFSANTDLLSTKNK